MNEIEHLKAEVKRLTEVKNGYRKRAWSEYLRRLKAQAGLKAVVALINESEGVAGLHQNGDVASWDSLQTGGMFEEWLIEFDDAVDNIRPKHSQPIPTE